MLCYVSVLHSPSLSLGLWLCLSWLGEIPLFNWWLGSMRVWRCFYVIAYSSGLNASVCLPLSCFFFIFFIFCLHSASLIIQLFFVVVLNLDQVYMKLDLLSISYLFIAIITPCQRSSNQKHHPLSLLKNPPFSATVYPKKWHHQHHTLTIPVTTKGLKKFLHVATPPRIIIISEGSLLLSHYLYEL